MMCSKKGSTKVENVSKLPLCLRYLNVVVNVH